MNTFTYLDDSRVEILGESGIFFTILLLLISRPAWLFWLLAIAAALCFAGVIIVLILLAKHKTEYKNNQYPSIIVYWQTIVTCVILLFRQHELTKAILCIVAIAGVSVLLAYNLLKKNE